MRGKVLRSMFLQASSGITPAYAGKRASKKPAGNSSGDHPRTCGEKRVCLFLGLPLMGSPPHMRGKVENMAEKRTDRRITPAHAGKSPFQKMVTQIIADHPRTCGEKPWPAMPQDVGQGSPPHMRGKDLSLHSMTAGTRITPAHAGKRDALQDLTTIEEDHPRTCGEKAYSLVISGSEWGSPPHMRGKAMI